MKKSFKGFGFYLVVPMILLLVFTLSRLQAATLKQTYEYGNFLQDLKAGNVKAVVISQNEETPSGRVAVTLKGDKTVMFYVPDVTAVEGNVIEYSIPYNMLDVEKPSIFLTTVLPYLLIFVAIVFLFLFMSGQAGGGGNSKVMNFGKSRAKMTTDEKTTFKDVAGLREEKEELEEIVDFLKAPKKYVNVGISEQGSQCFVVLRFDSSISATRFRVCRK